MAESETVYVTYRELPPCLGVLLFRSHVNCIETMRFTVVSDTTYLQDGIGSRLYERAV